MTKSIAIVLSAGKGKRMNSNVPKQYMELAGHPILYYSLKTFEESRVITDVILVVGEGDEQDVRENIVEKYELTKVRAIVCGGKERYHSVYQGLCTAGKLLEDERAVIYIHDGARPFVTQDMIDRCYAQVQTHRACVVGMPVKDTIKIADEQGFAQSTPRRDLVWMIQTPQVFDYELIYNAYDELIRTQDDVYARGIRITDDAMVVETFTDVAVKLVEGSYQNIKITTPEDIAVAEFSAGRTGER